MGELRVGNPAPRFRLRDQRDQIVRLEDFRDWKLLVYFYPRAGTPG